MGGRLMLQVVQSDAQLAEICGKIEASDSIFPLYIMTTIDAKSGFA